MSILDMYDDALSISKDKKYFQYRNYLNFMYESLKPTLSDFIVKCKIIVWQTFKVNLISSIRWTTGKSIQSEDLMNSVQDKTSFSDNKISPKFTLSYLNNKVKFCK